MRFENIRKILTANRCFHALLNTNSNFQSKNSKKEFKIVKIKRLQFNKFETSYE